MKSEKLKFQLSKLLEVNKSKGLKGRYLLTRGDSPGDDKGRSPGREKLRANEEVLYDIETVMLQIHKTLAIRNKKYLNIDSDSDTLT